MLANNYVAALVVIVVPFLAVGTVGGEEPDGGEESGESEEGGEETDRPPGGDWWGPIQGRADRAYDQMSDEIETCLDQLSQREDRVREIGLEARKLQGSGGEYRLVQVTARPGEADEHPCVERLARDYVEAVGPGIGDDFEQWVATFVDGGEEVGAAGCAESPADGACASMEAQWGPKAPEVGEAGACPDRVVEAVEEAIRDNADCWRGGTFRERRHRFVDVPIRTRAVMTADLIVEKGSPAVVLRHNRPWVEPMISCMAEQLEERRLELEIAEVSSCHSRLNNRAVTLWYGPSFHYAVEE